MIPVGGIIGAILVARMLMNRGKPGSRPAPPPKDYAILHRRMGLAAVSWGAVGILVPVVLAFLLGEGLVAALRVLLWWGWVAIPILPVSRRILVPLGAVRWSYGLTRRAPLGSPVYPEERVQYASMLAALALLRRKSHDPELEAWIRQRLDRGIDDHGMKAPGLAASALLAASRGETAVAREFMVAVLTVPRVMVAPPVRTVVLRWLIADAASSGRWDGFVGPGVSWSRGGLLRFGREVAWSRSDRRSRAKLLWTWLICGPRLRLWKVFRMAWHVPEQPASVEARPLPGADPVEQALAAHAAVETSPSPRAVIRAVEGWRAALDGEKGASLPADVRAEVLDSLAGFMDAVGLSVRAKADGSVVGEIYQRQRERVWAALSDEVQGMDERVREKKLLPAVDEWRAWFSVRRCMGMLDGPDGATAMGEVGGPLTNIAAALYNQYSERALAHAMFQWLAEHAARYGFSELQRINENNTRVAA